MIPVRILPQLRVQNPKRLLHTTKLTLNNFKKDYQFTNKCPEPIEDTGCTFCQIPEFPRDKQLDTKKPLRNSKSHPWKHAIVLSSTDPDYHNWPSRFEMFPGTIISEIQRHKRDILDPYYPCLVSMTNLNESFITDENQNEMTLLGLYPDGLLIEVPNDSVEEFMMGYFRPLADDTETDPDLVELAEVQKELKSSFNVKPVEHDYVLICGHTKRDVRCGKLAPLIKNEFEAILSKEDLLGNGEGKVKVGIISHIGGHVYAGNVLIFKQNGDVIWYGRVLPQHVQGIVQETIKGDKIIEELFRG